MAWVAAVGLGLGAVSGSAQVVEPLPSAPTSSQHQHDPGSEAVSLYPAREASGTSWLPDETPIYGIGRSRGPWQLMFHGSAFAQFIYEPGDRHRTGGFGTRQLSSVNWGMVMARRRAGSGRVGLRAMASLEPWTVADCGFLNYLATGEMCEGDTIHDRQHPHDLFMELAADYDRPLRGEWRWQVYAGLAGEPALGPSGFPHRVSAMPSPIAPVAHHWLDSSHITFGLVTTGIYNTRWKAEASAFNGREPDENRADLDLARLDSVSGRLILMPTRRLAVQVSAAHLHASEAEFAPQPRSSVDRATASATYHRALGSEGIWATMLAYGVNSGVEIVPGAAARLVTHAVLLESNLSIRDRHSWFTRIEVIGKPAHDLHAHEFPTSVFAVAKMQGGYTRHFTPWKGVVPGIGAIATANIVELPLASRYSGQVVPGFNVFLVLQPRRHLM